MPSREAKQGARTIIDDDSDEDSSNYWFKINNAAFLRWSGFAVYFLGGTPRREWWISTGGKSAADDFLACCWRKVLEKFSCLVPVKSAMCFCTMSKTYSMMTSAAIASTIGTALGATQGSCLPFAANVPQVPSYAEVSWSLDIVAAGLKATLK